MESKFEKIYVKRKIFVENLLYISFKRLIDLLGAAIVVILLLPIYFIISLFYLFGENKGSIIFRQKRIGLNGNEFYIYKFRSMIVNAEEKLKEDPLLYKKYVSNNYKLNPNEDPRITSFGCFLRKTSLDELPQFLNVLMGTMSLVGPRPVVREELLEYKEYTSKFLSVKPGITGYWQTNGRSNVGYPERVDIELHYVENRSLRLDFIIILRTFYKVILKSGAY